LNILCDTQKGTSTWT